ncbi:hypothetical protein ASD45_19150 [Pseudolabrys sp. Root1462]|uniref:hypothetical protein n=1 Tax=Pseudolabrys sp. Root1462 TaxID=1736466 RepID=UPI000702C90E|nr:hypothetical protein [Pseudolabrys sp. Root1462]KQY98098.1 hypothetical protein ASD45_19150 [Pseudolabrys sp. Root1462]
MIKNDRGGLYCAASVAATLAGYDSPREFLDAVAHDASAPKALPGDALGGPTFNRAEVIAWRAKRINGYE